MRGYYSLKPLDEIIAHHKKETKKCLAAVYARRAVPARSKATIDATSQALSLPSARRPASPPRRHFCHNILVLAAVFADG